MQQLMFAKVKGNNVHIQKLFSGAGHAKSPIKTVIDDVHNSEELLQICFLNISDISESD